MSWDILSLLLSSMFEQVSTDSSRYQSRKQSFCSGQ